MLVLNQHAASLPRLPPPLQVYLCTNRVAPAHEGIELGIGDATLIKARIHVAGRN